jgi:integrase
MRLGPANVLSETEVRAVLDACSRKTRARRFAGGERSYALVMLLWRAGLRINEALDLEPRDLRFDAQPATITVRSGKGDKARVVGAHPELVAAIADWMVWRPASRWLFCTPSGARLVDADVRRTLRRKGKRCGVDRVHPHAFRATLAVELVLSGTPLTAIRDVLGHSNLAVTDAYLRRVHPHVAINALIDR